MVAPANNKILIRIAANDETANAAQSAIRNVRSVATGVREADTAAKGGGLKSFLGDLKGDFGRNSTVFQLAKLAGGGGAIIGLKFATAEIAHMAEAAKGVADAFRSSGDGAGDAVEKLLGALPILGNLYQAGRSIREIFSAEQADATRITKEAQETNTYLDAQRNILNSSKETQKKILEIIREINKEQDRYGKSPASLSALGIDEKLRARIEQVREEQKKGDDENKKQKTAERAALQKEIDEARKRVLSEQQLRQKGVPEGTVSVENEQRRATLNQKQSRLAALDKEAADAKAANAKQAAEAIRDAEDLAARERTGDAAAAERHRNDLLLSMRLDLNTKQAEMDAAHLRERGKNLDAELLLARDHLARELAEIEKSRVEANLAHPEESVLNDQNARGRAAMAQAKQILDEGKLRQQARKEEYDHGVELDKKLTDLRADHEEALAKAGQKNHAQDLARLKIQDEYNGKRRELLAVLASEQTSELRRLETKRALRDLDETEAARLAQLRTSNFDAAGARAHADDQVTLSGVADLFERKMRDEQSAAAKDAYQKELSKIRTGTESTEAPSTSREVVQTSSKIESHSRRMADGIDKLVRLLTPTGTGNLQPIIP
jgi:hypothetical protein